MGRKNWSTTITAERWLSTFHRLRLDRLRSSLVTRHWDNGGHNPLFTFPPLLLFFSAGSARDEFHLLRLFNPLRHSAFSFPRLKADASTCRIARHSALRPHCPLDFLILILILFLIPASSPHQPRGGGPVQRSERTSPAEDLRNPIPRLASQAQSPSTHQLATCQSLTLRRRATSGFRLGFTRVSETIRQS
jgi:hypothetical protein